MRGRWGRGGSTPKVRLVSFRVVKETAYRALHAFGRIPTFERGDHALLETRAIVFHIVARQVGLPPNAYHACANPDVCRAQPVEPSILEINSGRATRPDTRSACTLVEDRARPTFRSPEQCRRARLGAFSACEMMVSVLLRLKSSGILDEFPNLAAYLARGEARPSYKRACPRSELAVSVGSHRRAD